MLLDTIVAISTPLGEGAIGIIRMTGPDSFQIFESIFKKGSPSADLNEDKKMFYGHIINEDQILDEVMAVKMFAPKTYTKENIVEIYCHGGVIPVRSIFNLILSKGARVASPGEFTQRAFLNGRIDLAQAESVMDLVSAKTEKGFNIAMNHLEGHLSQLIQSIRKDLIQIAAEIDVCIDYPEEDIEEITYSKMTEMMEKIIETLERLKSTSKQGRIIREGLKVAIVGKPNVGKSSLMNALLKETRAIVTDIPGTTRDIIEEHLNIAGIPIRLVDTAGIRHTEDVVEKIGVERSKSIFNEADLVIFVLNGSEALTHEDESIMEHVKDKHALVIINKSDLNQVVDIEKIQNLLNDKLIVRTSVHDPISIQYLEKQIESLVLGTNIQSSQNDIITNMRHIDLIEKAYVNVQEAYRAALNFAPYDLIEVDLKDAIMHLGHITGESVEEDLIQTIFSQFCLGK